MRARLENASVRGRFRTRWWGASVVAFGLVIGLVPTPAGAQDTPEPEAVEGPVIDVIQVSGLVDPVIVDFLDSQLADADADFAAGEVLALVIQLNSHGATVPDDEILRLTEDLRAASVPVGVWVGPPGARATGRAAYLLAGADLAGVAAGARIGDLGPPIEGEPPDLLGERTDAIRDDTVGRDEARELGLVGSTDSLLGDFVLALEDQGLIPPVSEVVTGEDIPQRQLVIPVRNTKLGLVDQLFHTVASSNIAYLLLLAGLGLLLLELFTAGVGIAGGTGAGALVLAAYGLDVLPSRPWAIALLVVATVAFGVDVQAGVPRFWTAVGTIALLVGTFWLFDGVGMSWLAQVAGIAGMLLLVIGALPNLVRTRFGTNTIGREWMIGEQGVAATAIDPEGSVRIREALWSGRVNRATPIAAGDPLRVVGIDGPVLQVEPLVGAARDHRERRRSRHSSPGAVPTSANASEDLMQ